MSVSPPGLACNEIRQTNPSQEWLASAGKLGELIQSIDWTESPLGPIESWPPSLCTTVSLCLASNFPISLAWGREHTQIYNAGYVPICGEKHPHAMGQNFRECWASAWPVIGEAFEHALTGETSFLEDQRMFLDRNGYLEETFFTFSFSPIRDEHGVAGLFHPVTETTARMLSERRTRALRDLGTRTGKSQTVEQACSQAMETLSSYPFDLPFLLLYLFDAQGEEARLACSTGVSHACWANPERIDILRPAPLAWPLETVYHSGLRHRVEQIENRFGNLVCGEYSESIQKALLLPITPPGSKNQVGVLVAGVSPRLPLNEAYEAFYDLLGAAVTSEVANARAYEEDRRRAEALAEIDRAKTHFFSNVSHEFRTPLTLMLGTLEEELGERAEPLPPARRDRLVTAHRNSLRLLKLVNNLLDFSRLEAGRVQASYEPTDLAAYTIELASVFSSAMEKAGVLFHVDCPALPEPVFVDRDMWEKIVLNLLSNALKHTFAGSIAIHLQWLGDRVELAVTDTGVGIAADQLPHLFERFHRVQGAKSRTYEGTGIGLALVRELALLHGGKVDIHSMEGRGSTFTVSLQTGTAHLPAERLTHARALEEKSTQTASFVEETAGWLAAEEAFAVSGGAAASAAPRARRPQILLADDNTDMREYVTRLLSQEYEVVAVSDGVAALEAAQAAPPDLVLTDIMMPRLDGFGLLRALRAGTATRTIPVVFLSARAGQEQAIEGLQAGADDYLAKPFSSQELMARVHTHLEQARIRGKWANELQQSNKELETLSYSVSHDLRAPLRAIDGFSKLLIEDYADKLGEQGCRYLERVRSGTQTMSSVINNLLSLSRVSRGVLRKQATDLSAMTRHILTHLVQGYPSRKVEINIEDGLVAEVDRRLMKIVLLNLIDNAWKFSARSSPSVLAFGRQSLGREDVYFMRDNGTGFDQAHADRLFKPFQRLHHAAEFPGSGIGLATVHRVIVRHGGRIWAEAAPNTGATFYFTLGDKG